MWVLDKKIENYLIDNLIESANPHKPTKSRSSSSTSVADIVETGIDFLEIFF